MKKFAFIALLAAFSMPAMAAKHKDEMAKLVKERVEKQFKEADKDGDGKLSKAEAEVGMPYQFKYFDVTDSNKDGFLTLEEISSHNELKATRTER